MTNVVRGWVIAVALPAMAAVPAVAQEPPFHGTRGYVSPFGGTVWDGDTTGNLIFEGGARVAPHLLAFGNVGRFNDLQPDLTPSISSQTAALPDGTVPEGGTDVTTALETSGVLSAIATRVSPPIRR